MIITHRITARGFGAFEFQDSYANRCSIQESSNAQMAAIWLGIVDNFNGEHVNERMHLTQEQVAQLLPILAYFAENGELPASPSATE